MCNHLIGLGEDFSILERLGDEMHTLTSIISRDIVAAVKHQHRQRRHAKLQLSHKSRAANPSNVLAGDDQAQIRGKLRLFNQTERFSGIADSLDVGESILQDRLADKGLEGIVID